MINHIRGLNRQFITPFSRRRYLPLKPATVVSTISLADALTFTQTVTPVRISNTPPIVRSIIQTIAFTQNTSTTYSYRINVSQNIDLTQLLDAEVWFGVSDTADHCLHEKPLDLFALLEFHECVDYTLHHNKRRYYKTLGQNLTFTQTATASKGEIYTYSLTQNLTFSERLNNKLKVNQTLEFSENVNVINVGKYEATLNQTLAFTQIVSTAAINVKTQSVNQSLAFHDDFTNHRVRTLSQSLSDRLTFTNTVGVNTKLNLTIAQKLSFFDLDRRVPVGTFGSSAPIQYPSGDPNRPPVSIPSDIMLPVVSVYKVRKLITMQGVGIITLPVPLWGDKEKTANTMNLRRAMFGATYTYVKTNNRRNLSYSFNLGRRKSLELRAFLKDNLSTPIKLTNYYKGESWLVKLANTPVEFTFQDRSPTDHGRIQVELQLEGIRL